MDILPRKVENQVQFWSLLGPFIILLSITVLLFKVSEHWYFPVCGLIGIPLCVKWKMKGMAVALSCLFVLSVIAYQSLDLDERYWHVGMALAMAFSFIILTLSLEEVHGLVDKLQLESQSRLDNFLRIDEQWKAAEQVWMGEREKLCTEAKALSHEITKVKDEKQTFYKLAQLAKEEILQIRTQHDQLLQDLFYKKQQIAQLHERIEETEMTVQEFVNADPEKVIEQLKEELVRAEQEKATIKAKVALIETEWAASRQERDRKEQELIALQIQSEEQELIKQIQYEEKLQELTDRFQDAQNELENSRNQAKENNEILSHIHEALEKLAKELSEEQEVSQKTSEQLESLRHLNQQLVDEKKALLEAQSTLQQEAERQKFEQQQIFEKEIVRLKEHCEELREEKIAFEQQRIQGELNQELELALQQARSDLETAQRKLDAVCKQQEKLPYADGNTRKIESMYLQLKDQFQEKSAVLDDTRRELFHVHEELLKKQREYEEQQFENLSLEEKAYQRDLLRLGNQFEQMKKLYQQEIDDLTNLVGDLLAQLSRNSGKRT